MSALATASRTMLLDIERLDWDRELLARFSIPAAVMPSLVDNDEIVGTMRREILGYPVPVGGLCVDQQAALYGERCTRPGSAKCTYGTGCFLLANVGGNPAVRGDGLLTSLGWRVAGQTDYVLDGGVYAAGSLVRWLVSSLGLARSQEALEARLADGLAAIDSYLGARGTAERAGGGHGQAEPESVQDQLGELLFVPGLQGLAAPYWKSNARGVWSGMQLSHSAAELVFAALEAIAFRIRDIVESMERAGVRFERMVADGGLAANGALMQLQADVLERPVAVTGRPEVTAYGTALFAMAAARRSGLTAGESSAAGADAVEPADIARTLYKPSPTRSEYFAERYRRWRGLIELYRTHVWERDR